MMQHVYNAAEIDRQQNPISYKRRVQMLIGHDQVVNMTVGTNDYAQAALWVPAAQLVDGPEQAARLTAIHDAVGIKLLNDFGEIDMHLLDPANMTREQYIALWDALDEIDEEDRASIPE